MIYKTEVAIIGASIAGSTLAYQLANAGIRVTLIDKKRFPRTKACGEGLSWRGVEILNQMGFADELAQSKPAPFHGYSILLNNSKKISIRGELSGVGINRSLFDLSIFRKVSTHPFVTSLTNHPVTDINIKRNEVYLRDAVIKSQFIVDASGGGIKLSQDSKTIAPKRYGISFHVNAETKELLADIKIICLSKGELFITPLNKDSFNVCYLSPINFSHLGSEKLSYLEVKELVLAILKVHDFSNIKIIDTSGAILTLARRKPVIGNNFLRVGDSCEQLDPISGMGMTHALLCSKLAAQTLQDIFERKTTPFRGFSNYVVQREQVMRSLRGFTAVTSHAIRSWARIPYVGEFVISHLGSKMSKGIHRPEFASGMGHSVLTTIGALI